MRGKLLAYFQLMRLPNVFTAMADILLGFFFTHPDFQGLSLLFWLLAASSLLYTAGMVLNDVFDLEVDRQERPERPLPSGRIPLVVAHSLGWGFLIVGVALTWVVSWLAGDWRPGIVGCLLAAAIVAYDAFLKQTPFGPLGMGSCRLLNVLLGMSVVAGAWQEMHFVVAGGIGLYIVGVTWFARQEAEESSRGQLLLGIAGMLAGIGLLAWFPSWPPPPTTVLEYVNRNWYLLLLLLTVILMYRCSVAVQYPSPATVQRAVKNCILSLVVIDATVCFAVQGMIPAVIILALLLPTLWLGRWVYST